MNLYKALLLLLYLCIPCQSSHATFVIRGRPADLGSERHIPSKYDRIDEVYWSPHNGHHGFHPERYPLQNFKPQHHGKKQCFPRPEQGIAISSNSQDKKRPQSNEDFGTGSVPQPIPQTVPQANPQPIPQTIPQANPQPIPQTIPQANPQPIPQQIPRTIS